MERTHQNLFELDITNTISQNSENQGLPVDIGGLENSLEIIYQLWILNPLKRLLNSGNLDGKLNLQLNNDDLDITE